jgi:hypothetical protein
LLGHELSGLEQRNATRGKMCVIGDAVAYRSELGIMLGRNDAGSHDLHLGYEIDEVSDGGRSA